MLRDLSANKLRHLAQACASQLEPVTFTAANAPHHDFEKAHLPQSDMLKFAQDLVAYARERLGANVSLAFSRVIAVEQKTYSALEAGAAHLENILALELATCGIYAVRVQVVPEFDRGLFGMAHITLNGVVVARV